ncbi:hypothetical protein MTR67_008036 [Solanum verrucosum]|uniref:Uncharacterized protein n=1 Tax=Solanum verrucosum TaxID=315347 RepID=A0AAF0Q676_SOLVR|nr:hypothetical protein MTR67_008036 [Solanum verrucosum]
MKMGYQMMSQKDILWYMWEKIGADILFQFLG